jgi:hypothetical protein
LPMSQQNNPHPDVRRRLNFAELRDVLARKAAAAEANAGAPRKRPRVRTHGRVSLLAIVLRAHAQKLMPRRSRARVATKMRWDVCAPPWESLGSTLLSARTR